MWALCLRVGDAKLTAWLWSQCYLNGKMWAGRNQLETGWIFLIFHLCVITASVLGRKDAHGKFVWKIQILFFPAVSVSVSLESGKKGCTWHISVKTSKSTFFPKGSDSDSLELIFCITDYQKCAWNSQQRTKKPFFSVWQKSKLHKIVLAFLWTELNFRNCFSFSVM